MLCCLPAPIPDDATVQQTKLMRILRFLIIGQLVLGVLTLLIDVWEGIIVMIGASFLWCVTCGKNWCTCVIYILLCIMDGLTTIIAVGDYCTKHGSDLTSDSYAGEIVFILLLKIPFYIVSVFYSFLSYRELKALFIDAINNPQAGPQQGMFSGFGGMQPGYQQGGGYPYQPPPAPQQPPSYQPFGGAGYRVG